MADITLKRKEAKTITLSVTDDEGAVNLVTAELTFMIKKALRDTAAIVTKDNVAFNKTDAANGNVSFVLTATDTDRIGDFIGELKIYFSANDIDKSGNITIKIEEAITD